MKGHGSLAVAWLAAVAAAAPSSGHKTRMMCGVAARTAEEEDSTAAGAAAAAAAAASASAAVNSVDWGRPTIETAGRRVLPVQVCEEGPAKQAIDSRPFFFFGE